MRYRNGVAPVAAATYMLGFIPTPQQQQQEQSQ